jgi:hypothetical protein
LTFSCPIFQVGIFEGSINHNKRDGANKYSSTYSIGYTLVPGLRSDTIWTQGSIGSQGIENFSGANSIEECMMIALSSGRQLVFATGQLMGDAQFAGYIPALQEEATAR